MKLNKREKQIILKAVEIIDKKETQCSCDAIKYADRHSDISKQLVEKYNEFYMGKWTFQWPDLPVDQYLPKRRSLMLLFFLEVNS